MGLAVRVDRLATLPAAVPIEVQEALVTEDVARLRLIVRNYDGVLSFDDVETAFDPACAYFAQELEKQGIDHIERVVVSISDRELPFGETSPEANQFFELYDLVDGACVWRGF